MNKQIRLFAERWNTNIRVQDIQDLQLMGPVPVSRWEKMFTKKSLRLAYFRAMMKWLEIREL